MEELNGLKRWLGGTAGAVIVALIFQSAALVWWAASITTRVNYVEKHLEANAQRIHELEVRRQ